MIFENNNLDNLFLNSTCNITYVTKIRIMSTTGFYVRVLLTSSLISIALTKCTRNITCPCGNDTKAVYYTHCLNKKTDDYSCERWAFCKTCRTNKLHCLSCPQGWTGPTCTQATCPDPGIPDGGVRRSENGSDETAIRLFLEGETVYFSCKDKDFYLKGESSISCTSIGIWSHSLPSCEKATCPDPGIPDGGLRRNENGTDETATRFFLEGETLYFSCKDEDSYIKGESFISCTSIGVWSHSLPTCKRENVRCPDPGVPEGASREGANGTDETPARDFQVGESLYIYCDDEDFFVDGDHVMNCTSFGNWSNPLPRCQRTRKEVVPTCPDPGIPEGGSRKKEDGTDDATERLFLEGESAYFSCNGESDVLEGVGVINCTSFGTWSHSLPRCVKEEVKNTCPDPGTPEGGNRQIPVGMEDTGNLNFQEGDSIYFYCNAIDFNLVGDSMITCTSFGTWSHTLPRCEKTDKVITTCPDPGIPEGGSRTLSDGTDDASERVFQEGETVYFTCTEKDSVLQGDNILICTSIGSWSTKLPTCTNTVTAVEVKRETCPDPGIPENGSRQNAVGTEEVAERTFVEGESLYFSCKDEDSVLKGDSHITCTSRGAWSGLLPKCEKIGKGTKPGLGKPCKHPGIVANGAIRNADAPDSLENTQQVFPSATRLKFQCDDGYKLQGESILFCLCSGEWTSNPPTCVSETIGDGSSSSVHCKSPGPIPNGGVNQNREMERQVASNEKQNPHYSVGARLHFNCNEGYILEGVRTVVCESSGMWSGKPPKCIEDPDLSTDDEEQIRTSNKRKSSGRPNSLTFKFFFY